MYCACICLGEFVHTDKYICAHLSKHSLYVHACTCMFITNGYIYACACIEMYFDTGMHVFACMYMYVSMCMNASISCIVCMNMYVYMCQYKCMCMYTEVCATYVYACM